MATNVLFPGSIPYSLPLLATALLTAGIAVYAFRRSGRRGAFSLGWLTIAISVWCAAYAMEILAPELREKILAAKICILAHAAAPVFWLFFALEYSGRVTLIKRASKWGLIALPFLSFFLALTNESHHLVWLTTGLSPQGFPTLFLKPGIWFWTNAVISFGLVLIGIGFQLMASANLPAPYKQHSAILALAAGAPLLADLSNLVLPTSLLRGLNPTPFTFAFSSIILAIGLIRFKFLDIHPISTTQLIASPNEGIIVMDENRQIVYFNAAARKWLKIENDVFSREPRVGLGPLMPIMQYWNLEDTRLFIEAVDREGRHGLDVTLSSLYTQGGETQGRIILVRESSPENTQLAAEQKQVRQMELLNSITRIALETNDLQKLLQSLADHLGELLEADGAFITLWDEARERAVPAAAYGDLRTTYPSFKVEPKETTLTASVLQTGLPLPIEDVFHTPYISPRIAAQFPARSILGLPLIAHGQKLGAALIAFNTSHHFTTQEVSLGERAATQIALAINRAQIIATASHRVAQLGLLQDISRQMAESLDEKEICERAVRAIIAVFGYAEAAISMLVEDNLLELKAIAGTEDMGFLPGFRQRAGQGIIGRAAETCQPYFTDDIIHDPYYYHPSGKRKGSAMAIPLLHEAHLLGVIYVESVTSNGTISEDRQTLEALASHLATAIVKARLYTEVHEHLLSMTTLQSVSQTVTSSLELNKVFKTVLQLLQDRFKYDYASIYLLEENKLHLVGQVGYPEDLIIYEIPISNGVTGRTIRTGQLQFVRDVKTDPDFLRASYEVESEICVPLLKEKNILGLLNVEAAPGRPLTEKDVSLLTALANPVAMAIDNARLHAEVLSLALTDGMTGLVNRRAFDQLLETEVVRAERYQHSLSLIIIDMDSFKEYNDAHGHPAGDERLKAIANLLRANVRDPDVAARYGGEEFAVILPHTDKAGAMALAERLRERAEIAKSDTVPYTGRARAGYTISLGVATFPEDGKTSLELLVAADNAEMTAKRLGKNRVCDASKSKGKPW